ncbi:PaaI family thioesterase [Mycolicibacterium flavescens]|uniref:Acyl-coenzyme A thioesterase THEM4 n=1 Tax=Mycolicibacterium flavescens TaxID=1776 RepID=A0A1E3RKX6_MYCFV|nr:PaaI family thioesterase [Mycolicibacterium flavescens]MCV7279050.1 PaaI family thioesterase [Mycolicibacterium flavescens]ODQ90535.1 thioesterase [Mycolicibacterium flavescens]
MVEFTEIGDVPSAEVERLRAVYGPLADSVRELIDATIRTEVDADTVADARAQIDAATARLRSRQADGPFGVQLTSGGDRMAWGNPVIGIRNPIAPPVIVKRDPDGRVYTDFELGAAFEGPPGHVHGGVAALVLDHLLGEVAANAESPRFTGTISLRYLRPTPLGRLHAEATITRVDGVKAYAAGYLADDHGPTVEAEGVFIQPKWAR